jgi:hypothetical protein
MGARRQKFMKQESCHYGSKAANIHETRKLSLWEQDGKYEKQESHYGSKMAATPAWVMIIHQAGHIIKY